MTPLFKKLNYKEHKEIIVLDSPQSFLDGLSEMKPYAKVVTDLAEAGEVDFAICFVMTQGEIDRFMSRINAKLIGDAVIWLCYPKASSKKYRCDFNRDTGFGILGSYGMEPVRQVAIDEDWSALRFRKVDYIKTMTRRESFALTKEGKQRTTQKQK